MKLPSESDLDAAGLMMMDAVGDGRCHVVEQSVYAGEVDEAVRCERVPRFVGLCGQELLAAALIEDRLPGCAGCVEESAPRARGVRAERAAQEAGTREPGALGWAMQAVFFLPRPRVRVGRHRAASG